MVNFEFHLPTKIIFGRDTEAQTGKLIADGGYKKVLIHYGSGSIIKSGLLDRVKSSLNEYNVDFVEKGGVQPNPTAAFCKETAEFGRENGVDFVLAVGGGSAIDSAKVAAHAIALGGDPWDFIAKTREVTGSIPVGVVLTIATAGSETSDSAVLTNEIEVKKAGLNTPFNRPIFAIMNPELTCTLPAFQTAAGVVDILMHTLERYFCLNEDNEFADRMCESLAKSVISAGRIAVQTPQDYEARATLMWAGSMSHNGIMGAGRVCSLVAHKFQHAMSAFDHTITHGAGLAVTWPAYLKFVCKHNLNKVVQYAVNVWNIDMDFEHPEKTALRGIRATEDYFTEIGMPTRLQQLGLDETHIDAMAQNCTFNDTITIPSYIPVGAKEAKEIYMLSM